MKRVFIVHGWDGNPKGDWLPWLKKELEEKGFKVKVPTMPNASKPKIEEWISHLKKVVGKLDQETYFVGHSIGCQTILRYLEKENFNGKVPSTVFVAGWFKLSNLENEEVQEIANSWLETPIDFNKIKHKINKITVFLSSNDPYGKLEYNAAAFREKLGATVIIEKERGHFTGEDGITEIPEVFNLLKNMSNKKSPPPRAVRY